MRTIHDVLDQRAVTPVFQPLVELDRWHSRDASGNGPAGGRIVGYEALSRGPAGTPWENPMVLFAAARAVGRDAELDWICRAVAYRAALAADLGPELTLFVNMEPTAWRASCPPDLAPVVDQAQQRLRVVTEMTERVIADDPAALLAAAAACRDAGWGVALDDVGADPMSLALMPFVQPDVVKLDMGLLRSPEDPDTARVVAAVYAYAEASGATILAEGIETIEHLGAARTMGATIGQGWHFGRPAPLPAQPARPRMADGVRPLHGHPGSPAAALPLLPAPVHQDRTPFEIVSAVRPVSSATKAQLMPISRHLEALAGHGSEPPVLFACFQEARHFTKATAVRYRRIATHSPLVAALGVGLSTEPVPGVRGACLGNDRLAGEWNVILVGPHCAAALVARDLGGGGPEGDRGFEFAVTHNRALVIEAARSLMHYLAPIGAPIPVPIPA